MRSVIQRVLSADLSVDGVLVSKIGKGLIVYFGVGRGDTEASCEQTVKKIAGMRIFEDEDGKMNLSIKQIGGEILFVSQFTLCADCSHGNRPSFGMAESPDRANALYEYAAQKLREEGVTVKQGVFGADMKINQLGDGPVTIVLDYN